MMLQCNVLLLCLNLNIFLKTDSNKMSNMLFLLSIISPGNVLLLF